MPLTDMTRRPILRTGRIAALIGVLLVVGLGLIFVGYQALAGERPKVVLQVRSEPAEGLGFDPATITAPANVLVAISFANVSTLDHNLVFLDPLDARTQAIVGPGTTDTIELMTPAAGDYPFVCTIHEGMAGSLTVR
jgi:plastocyanin